MKGAKWLAPTNNLASTGIGAASGAANASAGAASRMARAAREGWKGWTGAAFKGKGATVFNGLAISIAVGSTLVVFEDSLFGSEGWLMEEINHSNDEYRCATIKYQPVLLQWGWDDSNIDAIRKVMSK